MAQATVKRKSRYEGDFIRRSTGEKIFSVFNIVLMFLLTCMFLYPILNMVSISLSDQYAVLRAEVTFYPVGFTTQAYSHILKSNDLFRSIGNTAFVAGIGCVCGLLLMSLAAYPLAFGDFYGKKVFNILILLTMWFSAGIIPVYLNMKELGLLNSLWSLIVNNMLTAYYVVILRSNFEAIPMSIVESARIDGANDFRILFKLILPLSKPALATLALWIIVSHWNAYLEPLMFLTTRTSYTLQMILKEMVLSAEASIYNVAAVSDTTTSGAVALGQQVRNAVLVISMIPMVILYPFIQRYFISGVMLGSVKG